MQERQIMNHEDVRRALARVAHEILERNRGAEGLVIVGIHTRGVHLVWMPTIKIGRAHV